MMLRPGIPRLDSPLVTLTTDFGISDAYVPAMKGVLHALCSTVQLEDLTHEIPPQDITACAHFVACAMPYFPAGTIHVVVVDPGVGSKRRPLVAAAGGQIFVCPDNGLLTLFLQSYPLDEVRVISNSRFMLEPVSETFHGRDVFAPAAARIAAGAPLDEVGPKLRRIRRIELAEALVEENGQIQGRVIHVDHFGNCITNIHRRQLRPGVRYRVAYGAATINGISSTYSAGRRNQPLALFGSCGQLEIALRDGDASETLGLDRSAPITLYEA